MTDTPAPRQGGTDSIPEHMRAGTQHALTLGELADAVDAHVRALRQHAEDAETIGITDAPYAQWEDTANRLEAAVAAIRDSADIAESAANIEIQQLTPVVEAAGPAPLRESVTVGALRD